MRILYIVANVLGDSGANAAEIFPKLANQSSEIDKTVVADFSQNKNLIEQKIKVEYLELRSQRYNVFPFFKNATCLARYTKRNDIDVIHAFYRLRNIPLIILLRLALVIFRSKAKILMDHRSVNLVKGKKRFFKMCLNALMQPFVHQLTGNPLATKSNHWIIYKPDDIIDLGYDRLPDIIIEKPKPDDKKSIWFIGTMEPENRKSEFLFDVFNELERRYGKDANFTIRVAGPARTDQLPLLTPNSLVEYYGLLPRHELYELLAQHPGIGIAYMNEEHHALAPSLKFSEYASMSYAVVASDTIGMRTQAKRMGYPNVTFAKQTVDAWADQLAQALDNWPDSFTTWDTKDDWSYKSIFANQVIPLYQKLSNRSK